MINYINKATQKFANYFTYIEKETNPVPNQIEEDLIYLNSQLVLWRNDSNYEDWQFNNLFSHRFNNKFMVYNLVERKIDFKTNNDKVVDFKAPDYPSYTLEFLLSFAIAAKNWVSLDSYNILLVHDDLKTAKVLSLLCTTLAYINKSMFHPLDLYANIISTNQAFAELANIDLYKNITRYMNYFALIQSNPIVEFKKVFLKTIIISGAPAIDNSENAKQESHYITINKNSFYSPVIRIISNGKVAYCSFKKNQPVEPIPFSSFNCTKFDICSLLFGDTIIEVLHKQSDKFKQLFLIQFHSFFANSNGIRFTKDLIDGVCKDIRYPEEFYVDLIFDEQNNISMSNYEDEIVKWKSIISDFIVKSYRPNSKSKDELLETEKDTKQVDKKSEENSRKKEDIAKMSETEKEEDITSHPNTTTKAQDIIDKFQKGQLQAEANNDEEDDEDIENYLKDLENKTK